MLEVHAGVGPAEAKGMILEKLSGALMVYFAVEHMLKRHLGGWTCFKNLPDPMLDQQTIPPITTKIALHRHINPHRFLPLTMCDRLHPVTYVTRVACVGEDWCPV